MKRNLPWVQHTSKRYNVPYWYNIQTQEAVWDTAAEIRNPKTSIVKPGANSSTTFPSNDALCGSSLTQTSVKTDAGQSSLPSIERLPTHVTKRVRPEQVVNHVKLLIDTLQSRRGGLNCLLYDANGCFQRDDGKRQALIEVFYDPNVLFVGSLFERQREISAPHVHMVRVGTLNSSRRMAALDDVSRGDVVAFIGAAGTGKSHELSVILNDLFTRLLNPDSSLSFVFFRVNFDLYCASRCENGVIVEHVPDCVTFAAQAAHIEARIEQLDCNPENAIFAVDLQEQEGSENPQLTALLGVCGVLAVVSHRHSHHLFKDADKCSGDRFKKYLVPPMTEDEIFACGHAMYDLEPQSCRFAWLHNSQSVCNKNDALKILATRMQYVGPILRFIEGTAERYEEHVAWMKLNRYNVMCINQDIDICHAPVSSGRFYAPVFRPGVVDARITTYARAVTNAFILQHTDTNTDTFRHQFNWEWAPVSPYAASLIASTAARSDSVMLTLQALGLQRLVHEYVSKSLLNMVIVDGVLATRHHFEQWQVYVDMGAGVLIAEEMAFGEIFSSFLVSLMRRCRKEEAFHDSIFQLRAEQMQEGVLYIGRSSTTHVYERLYRVGKLVILLQDSESSPQDHEIKFTTLQQVLEPLGVLEEDSPYKAILVYCTDNSTSNMVEGLRVRFDSSTEQREKFGPMTELGLVQWRRELREATVGVARTQHTPGFMDTLRPASAVISIIVRGCFYPNLSQTPLLRLKSDQYTMRRLFSALTRLTGTQPTKDQNKTE